jgi:tRNA pseudouridine55 synthase
LFDETGRRQEARGKRQEATSKLQTQIDSVSAVLLCLLPLAFCLVALLPCSLVPLFPCSLFKYFRPLMNPFEQGQVLLINKPYDWTSFDVVRKIRSMIKIKKVGHAGTLDPLATGLLILCTGKFTKRINEYMAQEKEYTGTFVLGEETPTYDLESIPVSTGDYKSLTDEEIHAATKQFIGEVMQVPPIHSAIKVDGKRVYELARKGIDVELKPRKITISEFEITRIQLPEVDFRIVCSTGTYIRSIANDYGRAVGSGAYLSALCRTRIGNFLLEDSLTIEEAAEHIRALRESNQNG